jgi:diaminohydroxyphosphoribosylaminopyrimidine deaminase / 5-amino-6-(5-phosphoribosylamino)uracil reductase
MLNEADFKFMRRCIDLAGKAEGMTYPNPMVGALISHNGAVIGEGFHTRAGEPHAEVIAINSVPDRSLLKESTLYVSLEPCTHFGKTPPCTDLILKSGIPRIVIGTTDTSDKVSGKGISRLKEAGREVVTGVEEERCRRINRRFFTFHEKKRPYITLKWAQSSDGFIDVQRPEGSEIGPFWISGTSERVLVHKWRSEEESILVGAGTVRTDRPALNVRNWTGRDPLRLVLSGSGKLPNYMAETETNVSAITFTYNENPDNGSARKILLNRNSEASFQVAKYLYEQGIQSLMIEGGAEVLNHFIATEFWDEARIFKGTRNFISGLEAPVINGKLFSWIDFGTSKLEVIINPKV